MPPPSLPKLIAPPKIQKIVLEQYYKDNIAKTLGLESLPKALETEGIAYLIGYYKGNIEITKSTTVANVKLTLKQIIFGKKRYFQEAVELLANDRAGVDSMTHIVLQPLAKKFLADINNVDVLSELRDSAKKRLAELEKHKRIEAQTEMLKDFCGRLRVLFIYCAAPDKKSSPKAMYHCAEFAKAVFVAGEIETPDFDAHPERLMEYLKTDVSNYVPSMEGLF